ncbi:MAG: hypothetical protein A2X84_14725 [Desulfuromonadaceae bacterium GWC2_58_13]|nr:MAG: hypothetical protein A2X84_14725 [Desulfuromonadaceae bacterium GWC2_58_13]
MDGRDFIDFVVGEEKRLTDILSRDDVMPMLESAILAGVGSAMIVDEAEVPLWRAGAAPGDFVFLSTSAGVFSAPLMLEGEPVGKVCLVGDGVDPEALNAMLKIVSGALNRLISGNLKRMLTTEIHTKVVNQSYDELVEINRQLTVSEKQYRDLAESLEVRVRERTDELKRAYARMLQQEKLASVGQLAAGVAHEINNPLGFILSNLQTLRKYVGKFSEMLEFYRSSAGSGQMPAALRLGAESKWRELKLDFVMADLDELFTHSISGAERVKKIVADLRGFSHVDDTGSGSIRINDELERTLSVIAAEIPDDVKIVKEFGVLPDVKGSAGLLCQAFLNLIRNALQCRQGGLKLLIRTEAFGAGVRLSFIDNGPGIPEAIRNRIFEPFFTTRQVGQGMGMGLTVAYDAVKTAGGTIAVKSQEGRGSAFIIELPTVRSDK